MPIGLRVVKARLYLVWRDPRGQLYSLRAPLNMIVEKLGEVQRASALQALQAALETAHAGKNGGKMRVLLHSAMTQELAAIKVRVRGQSLTRTYTARHRAVPPNGHAEGPWQEGGDRRMWAPRPPRPSTILAGRRSR